MHASPSLDRTTRTAIAGAGVLFVIAGAGWAYFGTDIFIGAIVAGVAYCF